MTLAESPSLCKPQDPSGGEVSEDIVARQPCAAVVHDTANDGTSCVVFVDEKRLCEAARIRFGIHREFPFKGIPAEVLTRTATCDEVDLLLRSLSPVANVHIPRRRIDAEANRIVKAVVKDFRGSAAVGERIV